jgi:hypothetical protein
MRMQLIVLLAVISIPISGFSHHSFAEFDQTITNEYEGTIVDIVWRNPHVRLSIRATDNTGGGMLWRMEAQDINTLGRIGVSSDLIQEGQRVRFAGWPSLRQDDYLALTHLYLIDEQTEVVMRMRMAPRWTNDAVGGGEIKNDPPLADAASAEGIFRVWSFLRFTRMDFPGGFPLTESAREAFERFDPVEDDPVLRCEQPGMPEAITFIGPHPIEFIDEGDRYILRVESDDTIRVIHMSDGLIPEEQPLSALGFSIGHWEDENTLVVTTTRVNWPWTKFEGLVAVPQSTESIFIERFMMSDNQSRLSYGFTMIDPATFTEPVTVDEYNVWQWIPGAAIQPYECALSE